MIYQTTKGRYCTIISSVRFIYGFKEKNSFEVKGEVLDEETLHTYKKEGFDIRIINPKIKFLSTGKEAVINYKNLLPITGIKIKKIYPELLDYLAQNKIPYDVLL